MFQLLLKDKVKGKGSLFNFARRFFSAEPAVCYANRGFFFICAQRFFCKKIYFL